MVNMIMEYHMVKDFIYLPHKMINNSISFILVDFKMGNLVVLGSFAGYLIVNKLFISTKGSGKMVGGSHKVVNTIKMALII